MPLNFTKNQILILDMFFNQPQESYYLQEIGRKIGKKPGVFQRDINNLVEDGLLVSFHKGNNRFFTVNQKYFAYHELKSLFFKTLGIEGVLRTELKDIKGIKEAFIYGSVASGQEKKSSDVDLFIVGGVDENYLIDLVNRVEDKFGREINYVLMTEIEFQDKIKKKNSFLENILNKKRIILV